MPLYRITGVGRDTNRKRVRVYEADTQDEAFEKAYNDGTIIDVAATEVIPYSPASDRQIHYAKSLGINCPEGITEKELDILIEEAKKWASPKQIRLAEELGLQIPQKKMTWEQMSDFLDNAMQDCRVRKRYETLPPTKDQLRLAKEKGIKIPWRVTRQKLSALLDEAIEKEKTQRYQRDLAEYNKRVGQDDGTVRGRYISDNAALEALKGLLGNTMIMPDVQLRTRIFKGNKRGNIDIISKSSNAKNVLDFYKNLLEEKGFTVKIKSSSYMYDGKQNIFYIIDFKLVKGS